MLPFSPSGTTTTKRSALPPLLVHKSVNMKLSSHLIIYLNWLAVAAASPQVRDRITHRNNECI